jgi:hypothetical protein
MALKLFFLKKGDSYIRPPKLVFRISFHHQLEHSVSRSEPFHEQEDAMDRSILCQCHKDLGTSVNPNLDR